MTAELDRVRQYRRAARIAVHGDTAETSNRYLALIELAEAARAEPDPLVRTWAERAIWEESKVFLGVADEEHEFPPEAYERAQRRLRVRGYAACPECYSVLATDDDFERWRMMRLDHVAELERRERAIQP